MSTAACAAGPCASPAPVAYLAPAVAGGGAVVVANFGLLTEEAGRTGWQFVCDDLYGSARPELVRMGGDGRVFAAPAIGLLWTGDGCGWTQATGAVADRVVHDLAFEGSTARVWALAGEPAVLAVSGDGGARFEVVHAFGDQERHRRLLVARSDPRRLYVAASGDGATPVSTLFSWSTDGGASWSMRDLADGVPPLQNPFTLMAVAPDNPEVIFFGLVDAYGDEIWRSDDGGRSLRRVLKGGPRDWMTGLAFGPDPRTVFAAASVTPVINVEPPGHLFVSRDGGQTWGEPILSDRTGPSYRCLHAAGGKLVACGLGEPGGEAFLVGESADEGKSWQPLLRLQQLTGVKSCAQSSCAATEAWLCDRYNRCGPTPPTTTDAGAGQSDAAPVADGPPSVPDTRDGSSDRLSEGDSGGSGCGCTLGAGRPAGGGLVLGLAALMWVATSFFGRKRRRPFFRLHDRPDQPGKRPAVLADCRARLQSSPIALTENATTLADCRARLQSSPIALTENATTLADGSTRVQSSPIALAENGSVLADCSVRVQSSPIA
jgi:hypothetical protein